MSATERPRGWGVRDLTVRFGDRVALDGVSLEVPAGQVTAVVGGDGAGKTTLLRTLVGAVVPDAGELRVPEATRIGYLSATSGTYPDLSVAENLDFAAAGYGVPARTAQERVRQYLRRTGLDSVTGRLAGNLSGGMRQKLGVVRAMVHEPDLLVLDEPTTGIDPVSRADLWWLIARSAARGAAVVLTTAYLDEAERASRILVLDHGQALVEGAPDEIVAAMPGAIRVLRDRPDGDARRLAWRRGTTWRAWSADTDRGGTGETVTPDLQDAVAVAALTREVSR